MEGVTVEAFSEPAWVLDQFDLCFYYVLLCSSLANLRHEPILRRLVDVLVVVFADLYSFEDEPHSAGWRRRADAKVHGAGGREKPYMSQTIDY